MTPAAVHYGQAQALHAERQRVLDTAYAATPERFVRRATHAARATNRRMDQQANRGDAHKFDDQVSQTT